MSLLMSLTGETEEQEREPFIGSAGGRKSSSLLSLQMKIII